MLKISSTIILFNRKFSESLTLNSILNMTVDNIQLTLNIWNNGPNKLDLNDVECFFEKIKDKNISVKIYEDCRNTALSKIYNFLIEKDQYDFFTILDQDSKLQVNFFNNILVNKKYDMICPAIYTKINNGEQQNPLHVARIEVIKSETPFILSEILTINSGMTLSNECIKNIKKRFKTVFNENLAFYYIDNDLFARLKQCPVMEGICIGEIAHELTFTGKHNTKGMSSTVKMEYGYGRILNKYYISEKANKSLISMLIFTIKLIKKEKYNFKEGIKLLKCAITKKHPRCKHNIEIDKSPTYTN